MAGKSWKAWTQADDDLLESLRLEGKTLHACARALGRTWNSVRWRVGEIGAVKLSPRRVAYLEAFEVPHTVAGIAARFGVTLNAVRQMRSRLRRAGFEVLSTDGRTRAVS